MHLIMFFDFMQVLHIRSRHPTKNEYFPMHILFTTIYLLQEQKLNHSNYSKQEINMRNSVQATENYIQKYEKFGYLTCFWMFVIKYSNIWFVGILYKAIMHKMEFCQAYLKDILKRITRKFILYFFQVLFIFYEF
jgi:hypothetical protein